MRRTVAETLISFLLGAAWALALGGAILFFWSFLPFGFLVAFMAAFIGSLAGLLFVVLLEVAALQFDRQREIRHQTHLLKKILRTVEADRPAERHTGRPGVDDASLRDH